MSLSTMQAIRARIKSLLSKRFIRFWTRTACTYAKTRAHPIGANSAAAIGKPGTFIEYAKGLVDQLHPWYIEDEAIARDETFARMTLGIFFYDSMVVFEKRAKTLPFQCAVGRKQGLLGTLYWHLIAALHKRKR